MEQAIEVNPIISAELLHIAMVSFVLGCCIFAFCGYFHMYVSPILARWFKSLFFLDSQRDDLPELPEWDFAPAISHVRIIDNSVVPKQNKPYDWALEEDDYIN